MKTEIKEISVYVVEGKEFIDKDEAEKYEKELKKELNYTFFVVSYCPDLTEGRGYYKTTVLAVPRNYAEKATALQYCVDNFGKPLEFVMGVAPIPNWILNDGQTFKTIESLENFKKQKLSNGIGDYRKSVDMEIIYLDEKGQRRQQ